MPMPFFLILIVCGVLGLGTPWKSAIASVIYIASFFGMLLVLNGWLLTYETFKLYGTIAFAALFVMDLIALLINKRFIFNFFGSLIALGSWIFFFWLH